MKNLLDFLSRHYHWAIFVVLEIISMVLLTQYNSYQGSVWFSTANVVVGKVYEGTSKLTSFFSLTKANEDLARRNFYLERQVTQLRRLYGEATQKEDAKDRQQIDTLRSYQLLSAKVISSELDKVNNLMTVLNGRSSRISCAIRGHDYFGVLRWYGGDAGHAFVEDIPRHARFKKGDWVETNGYSSIFPAGVLVGQIVEVYNSRDGLSYKLKVRLSTDFGNLRDVMVITDKTIAERMQLMRAAQDSLKLNVNE